VVSRKIGDFDIDQSRPQVARHLCKRRNGTLGKVSIPLDPSGLLAIGQIERIRDIPALPAVIRRRIALG